MSTVKKTMDAKRKQTAGERKFNPTQAPPKSARWADLDGIEVLEWLARMSALGGALRLGLTRDGGAFAVGVYGDGSTPYTLYASGADELQATMNELLKTLESD